MREEEYGEPLPSADVLHQTSLQPLSIEDILAGLHHRTLGTEHHRHPLDITSMFSRGGLEGVPGLLAHIAGHLPHNEVERLRQVTPTGGPAEELGTARQRSRLEPHPLHLAYLLDAVHRAGAAQQGEGFRTMHVGEAAQPLQDLLGSVLGRIEEHHQG